MAWPPPTLPVNYSNVTPQQDEHPAAHNDTNAALNNDYRPKIDAIQTQVNGVESDITAVGDALDAHKGAVADSGPSTTQMQILQTYDSSLQGGGNWQVNWEIRHGWVHVWWALRATSNNLTPAPSSTGAYQIGFSSPPFPLPNNDYPMGTILCVETGGTPKRVLGTLARQFASNTEGFRLFGSPTNGQGGSDPLGTDIAQQALAVVSRFRIAGNLSWPA